MKRITRRSAEAAAAYSLIALLALFIPGTLSAQGSLPEDDKELPPMAVMADLPEVPAGEETAVLAGGCFWGMEGVFEHIKGVSLVMSGYSGGSAENAHYLTVSRKRTNHAESVYIVYDPDVVSYRQLLEVYFTVAHDPTQLNYQGPDHGRQYRSDIFYQNDEQKRIAEAEIADLEARGVYKDPVVTRLTAYKAFYPAEEYHQDFMKKNPDYPYIVAWDLPKIAALREEFPSLYVDSPSR